MYNVNNILIGDINMNKKFSAYLVAFFAFILVFNSSILAETRSNTKPAQLKPQNEPVTDLIKAYEIWKNKGIKLVIRDKEGKFNGWSTGRLESWGTKSKWVVRNSKGQFMTHATGNVESWKNGRTRLVVRDSKGRILTHIKIDLTDKGNFYTTAVGLRKLTNRSFLAFVQDSLGDILEEEIKAGNLSKPRALIAYLNKYKGTEGASNFKPVIRRMIPLLNSVNDGTNTRAQQTIEAATELLKAL